MQPWIAVLATYLVGAIPFGLFISRLISKRDPREHGSGNIGATNALRTGGKLVGALTLLADIAKGGVPVALAVWGGWPEIWVAAIAVTAALGHVFPIYLKFQGGKGVATMLGAVLPWMPWAALAVVVIWVLSLRITHYVSVSSILAGCILPLAAWGFGASLPAIAVSAFFSLLMTARHASNIRRLLDGTEPSTKDDRAAREASELHGE